MITDLCEVIDFVIMIQISIILHSCVHLLEQAPQFVGRQRIKFSAEGGDIFPCFQLFLEMFLLAFSWFLEHHLLLPYSIAVKSFLCSLRWRKAPSPTGIGLFLLR